MRRLTKSRIREKGNINLSKRPQVRNKDGSISTVKSISINENGREVLIPTVINGKVDRPPYRASIDYYRRTGQHLGKYLSVAEANRAAEALHRSQEKLYSGVVSRGHSGAAQILKPRSKAPEIHIKDIYNALASATGIDPVRGFRHPLKGGGTMMLPLGPRPKFPSFLMKPVGAEQSELGLDRIRQHMMAGEMNVEKAVPRLSKRSSARQEIADARFFGQADPRGSFLEHLARLQDPKANRAFLKWMMENYYKRPN